MERLTAHEREKRPYVISANERTWIDIYDRLAAYEDTGLEPEEIVAAENRRHDCNIECLLKQYNEVSDKLKAYQDTGLEPEEIEQLKGECFGWKCDAEKYKKAEADGRLVVLPCKVGDTVWVIDTIAGQIPTPWEVRHIGVTVEQPGFGIELSFSSFGKTVFLTREEAEAAMEGKDG